MDKVVSFLLFTMHCKVYIVLALIKITYLPSNHCRGDETCSLPLRCCPFKCTLNMYYKIQLNVIDIMCSYNSLHLHLISFRVNPGTVCKPVSYRDREAGCGNYLPMGSAHSKSIFPVQSTTTNLLTDFLLLCLLGVMSIRLTPCYFLLSFSIDVETSPCARVRCIYFHDLPS